MSTTVIAEIGVNHNGDVSLAKQMVESAHRCGADIVKFQLFRALHLASKSAPTATYQREATSLEESQQSMLKKLELSHEDFFVLKQFCDARGVEFCCTPFSKEDAEYLLELDVNMIKVGSGNLTDRPLHELLASTDKKIVISTGMATPEEIDETLKLYTATNSLERLTLLLCTSAYPTPPEDVHLRSMRYYEERFGLPVGLSDHTRGNVVAFAAAALGAVIIEKHFTTDRNLPGPDQQTSATPEEFADLVQGLRVVEKALGLERKPITDTEREIATVARKSIVAASNLSKGTILTSKDLCFKRPGTGASPMVYPTFLGKKLAIAIAADEMILPEHVEEP